MSLINNVHIKNFKSIRDLSFSTKRVNVFVGKPNVGKSNILEALSLYCAGYKKIDKKFLQEFVRFNDVRDLFYKRNWDRNIVVSTDIGDVVVTSEYLQKISFIIDPNKAIGKGKVKPEIFAPLTKNADKFYDFYKDEHFGGKVQHPLFVSIDTDDVPSFYYSPVKKYVFNGISSVPFSFGKNFLNLGERVLTSPNGQNMVEMLLQHPDLLEYFAEIFKDEYGSDLVIKSPENVLEVQVKDGLIATSTAINLTADTLQRLMFYLTAIKSNTGAVLLFEEPEANSFPMYTNVLADKIARDKNNQYFITTHSPYLLRTLLDETDKEDIAVFVTTYKDHQTHLHSLTELEISEMLDYDIDLFFNFRKYVEE